MAVTTSYLIGLAGDQFQLNGFENGEQFGVSLEALPDGGFAALYGNEFTSTNTLALSFFDAAYAMQTMAASSTNYVFPYSSTALEVQMLGTPVFDLDSEGNLLLRWVRDSSGPGYGNDQMTASVDPETGAITSPEQMIGNTINIGDIALAVSETTGYQGTLTLDYTFESLYFSVRDSSGDHVVLYGLGEFDTDYLSVQNVALPSGEILLAFVEDGLTSNPIKMQVRQDTGAAAGVFFTIDPVGVSDTDTDLALAALPGSTGGFALAYVIDVDGGTGIGLQVINDPNLDPDGSGLLRVDGMASSTDTDVALTVLENGLLLVSWTATLASGQTDIMARLYDEDGTPIGDPFLVSSGVTNAEGSAVEALANGDFAVGWIDALADSDGSSVQGQILAVTRTVEGDEDDNTLTGDLLADSLVGLGGNDTLVGAAGNDALFGDDDDDSLDGGTGDDTLSGGDGNDTIFGGAGDDTIDGDGGIDTADFSGSANGVSVTLSEGSTDGGATGEGTDVIRDIEIVIGSDSDDTITGNSEANTLDGGDGNDTIFGGAGNDTIDGDSGIDTADFSGSANGVTVTLGEGATDGSATGNGTDVVRNIENVVGSGADDTITGNSEANTFEGGDGDDSIDGGTGDDTIDGGTGNDSIFGDIGNDTIRGERGDDSISGGDGDDDIKGGIGNDTIYGGDGGDDIAGGRDNDILYGGEGVNKIVGQSGSDELYGGSERDILNGGGQNDLLFGFDGNDRLKGGSADDIAYGGDGPDKIYGNNGSDSLFGEGGDDLLNGGGLDDYLDGGEGDDRIKGGSGADDFVFVATGGRDVLVDFSIADGDELLIDSSYWDIGETAADLVADHAMVVGGNRVEFVFGDGNVIVLQGLTTTVGLETVVSELL